MKIYITIELQREIDKKISFRNLTYYVTVISFYIFIGDRYRYGGTARIDIPPSFRFQLRTTINILT